MPSALFVLNQLHVEDELSRQGGRGFEPRRPTIKPKRDQWFYGTVTIVGGAREGAETFFEVFSALNSVLCEPPDEGAIQGPKKRNSPTIRISVGQALCSPLLRAEGVCLTCRSPLREVSEFRI
jgi:hypothetical protein